MSDSRSVPPEVAALLAPLVREWALLREQEGDLFRRIAAVLERLAAASPERPAAPQSGDAGVAGRAESGVPAARPAAAAGGLTGDASSAAAEGPASGDPQWIDRTIAAVLAGAFSGDTEPEDEELPAVDLLLLRSGDAWVGIPWESVASLGLSDDAQPPASSAPLSLREILGLQPEEGPGPCAAEPYRLTWETAGGPRSLFCEVLGGVVAAPAAAARGVDLIWLPDDSEAGGQLLPLVEFFASGRSAGTDEIASDRVSPEAQGEPEVRLAAAQGLAAPAATPVPVAPAVDAGPAPPRQVPPRSEVPPRAPAGTPVSPPPAAPVSEAREGSAPRRTEAEHGAGPRGVRHPSRSALVSVRYLPARVAIARALRAQGWFVLEAADTEELPILLQRIQHTVVFTEAPERPSPNWIDALMRTREAGTRIIGVASRLRGVAGDPLRPLGPLPRLLYPFQDVELERLVESPAPSERD